MTDEPTVVFADESLAVVDKPAGLVVHAAPGHRGKTLVDVLGDLLAGGEPGRPGIVHRLDKDTSGLMLVARTDEAHRALSKLIAEQGVADRGHVHPHLVCAARFEAAFDQRRA